MSVLLDSNVLLRSAEPTHPHHAIAQHAVERLITENEVICIVPQVVYEFWVVATRPLEQNGLGFTTVAARTDIERILSTFQFFDDHQGIFAQWQELVSKHNVSGKASHDTRLVAAMQMHGMQKLMTFNEADFIRYKDIQILSPTRIIQS